MTSSDQKTAWFLLMLAACIASMSAGEDAGADGGLGFRGMEIYRFENDTSLLQTHDINGDGLDDIVFANNKASRLEVLVRARAEPPAEAGRAPSLEEVFDNRGVVVDQQLIACRTAKFNASDCPAILTMGRDLGLYLHRFVDDVLQPAQRIFLKSPERLMDMRVADMDGDGHIDIVVCRKDNLEILWNDGAGQFMRRTEISITPPDALKVETADFTGDGLMDLLIFMAGDSTLPRLRAGAGAGRFGAESILPVAPARRSMAMQLSHDDDPAYLAGIIQSARGLRLYKVKREPAAPFLEQDEILPARIALRGVNPRISPAWVVADFNGDGLDDFCVAAPELGQIHVYSGSGEGLEAAPARYDSLAGINAMSLTDTGDLLVFSAAEKTAALHARARLNEFPRLMPPPQSEPLIAAAHPRRPTIVWICRDSTTRDPSLMEQPITLSDRAPDGFSTDAPPFAFPLALPNDPDAIRVFCMDAGNTGIMLFIPYQPPVFYMLNAASELVDVPPASFNAASIALRPAMSDAKGDGNLLLGLGNVAREFVWRENKWRTQHQFSPSGANVSLAAAAFFQKTPGQYGVALFDQNANDLLWFEPDSNTPHQLHIGFPMAAAPVGIHPLRAAGGKHDAGLALITGQEIFVFHDSPALRMEQSAEYASPAEEPSLGDVRLVNLGRPPRPLMALTDTRNRAVEIIGFCGHKLTRRMAFEVFQDPGFTSARARAGMEPREMASGDVNGDGIGDLVLLVHDKLIIYPGE